MSNGSGHRWSKFWWQDYLNDQELKLCSLAAQGLWMRMLCVMHDADGYLLVAGRIPNGRQIAKLLTVSERQAGRLLDELLQHNVARKNNDGVIYCQRMISDFKASEGGREAADKRWNGHKPNGPPNGGGNGEPYSQAYRQPNARSLEAEEERTPPNPPVSRGGRRRGGFAELERRLEAASATSTIDATAEEVADFQAFRRRLAGGSNG